MKIASYLTSVLEESGNQVAFFLRFARNIFRNGFEWNEFIRQCYVIGYKSIGIVVLTGFILGFVLTLQSLPTLKAFGAQNYVPSMVSISMMREIGPVIIGLICAGKIASGISAELGSMNVTEQIDAMEISGANPIQYLVVTRILACTIMVPILTLVADTIALAGGFFGTSLTMSMNARLYFAKSFNTAVFGDFFPAFIKTFLFGFIIGFVGCYKGYHSNKGTESVGVAANTAVVAASVWIILIDAVMVQITNAFVYN
ncbi:MlaE family ABC transporter permease [Sediminibacterium soli]|uniref:MlaE family ABC transporter permease n=1 Tax=Sediminibacterium soli TaxID=2698829 RepID=UPI001379DF6B|nr:ABC transporter permease [Sediminibacterium soli]NCI45874.1 ABC transporter permease [Sediminibacterium soli]